MICPVCTSNSHAIFQAQILSKHRAEYFECQACKYIFIKNPHWLNEAYTESISSLDTGVMTRNLNTAHFVSLFLFFFAKKSWSFLDACGGYGIFVRLMRDAGYNFFWSDKYSKNLLSIGFEGSDKEKYDLITSFESVEHLTEPMDFFDLVFKQSKNLIISTEVAPTPFLQPDQWHYYCLNTGQHIGFFRQQTLQFIAKKYGKQFYSLNSYHLFLDQKVNPRALALIEWVSRKFPTYKFIQKLNGNKADEDGRLLNSKK